MKLTKAIKSWLCEQKGLSADATEDEFRKAAAEAMLDSEEFRTLYTKEAANPEAEEADAFTKRLDKILAVMEKSAGIGADDDTIAGSAGLDKPQEKGQPKRSQFDKLFSGSASTQESDGLVIRQVTADERYNKSRGEKRFPDYDRKGRKHPFAGQKLFEGGSDGRRMIDDPSELDQAICGAYFKMCLEVEFKGRVPQVLRMTDHDRELMQFALRNYNWAGVLHGIGSEVDGAISVKNRKLSDFEIKALLDDSTSDGLEIAPIVFDDMIITTPLLHGEFFPKVQVVNITRGRRIEGASIANVTLNSAGADGTNIDLENTASFVAAFDTTIHVVDGAIEIGLDFLSDSPVDVAGLITQSYGEQLLTYLDNQICNGDGSTEPEGVLVTSGTTSVNADNGASGAWTVGDYESLLFGVAKQFRTRGGNTSRACFGANETTYSRARGIAVSGTDQRRVFGMTHEDYMLLGHPYGIQGSIGNRSAFFANLAGYRMYRRLGLTVKATTEGKTLVRSNQLLISARARFGGSLTLGGFAATCADGQS